MILLVYLIFSYLVLSNETKKFAVDGDWTNQSNNVLCENMFLCTAHNLTWQPTDLSLATLSSDQIAPSRTWQVYNMTTGSAKATRIFYPLTKRSLGCKGLNERGITQIFLQGDSYMRHLAVSRCGMH
jgi:hypothetical protein